MVHLDEPLGPSSGPGCPQAAEGRVHSTEGGAELVQLVEVDDLLADLVVAGLVLREVQLSPGEDVDLAVAVTPHQVPHNLLASLA